MGCDGGTIPRRDELVRLKKKPEQKDKNSELSFRWRHCAISQQLLQEPIVGCGLGRLYSKSSLIEALLDKSLLPEVATHIRNLKDVKDLNLSPNPAYKQDAEGCEAAPYVCPVIGLEMTGNFRFVFLWTCGCVFSERALKYVNSNICHNCQKPFAEEDVIVLNGNEEDVRIMRKNMEVRNIKLKAEKKAKKGIKKETEIKTEASSSNASEQSSIKIEQLKTELQQKTETCIKSLSMKESITHNLGNSKINVTKITPSTSKSENGQQYLKRTAVGQSLGDPVFKKSKDAYSVAQDPEASEVFKSIFTTHSTATQQDKAHWITYNPFYN